MSSHGGRWWSHRSDLPGPSSGGSAPLLLGRTLGTGAQASPCPQGPEHGPCPPFQESRRAERRRTQEQHPLRRARLSPWPQPASTPHCSLARGGRRGRGWQLFPGSSRRFCWLRHGSRLSCARRKGSRGSWDCSRPGGGPGGAVPPRPCLLHPCTPFPSGPVRMQSCPQPRRISTLSHSPGPRQDLSGGGMSGTPSFSLCISPVLRRPASSAGVPGGSHTRFSSKDRVSFQRPIRIAQKSVSRVCHVPAGTGHCCWGGLCLAGLE